MNISKASFSNQSYTQAVHFHMNVLWWAQVAFSDQYPLPILWKELFDFYLTSRMGSWCETQCGKGAARGYHPEGASLSSKPTTRQAVLTGRGWTSESWGHGLVSAFSRTFERSTYVHQVHPLFWVKSFELCFWLVLMSKRSCDWHRCWAEAEPLLGSHRGPTASQGPFVLFSAKENKLFCSSSGPGIVLV